jgi:hypothetical protein
MATNNDRKDLRKSAVTPSKIPGFQENLPKYREAITTRLMSGAKFLVRLAAWLMPATLVASGLGVSETRARQNLLFGWNAVPRLLQSCLRSTECTGSDRKLLENVLGLFLLPIDKSPAFVFHSDRESEFCQRSRDVYATERAWAAPVHVCEPRLYDFVTGEPLWSAYVALLEMTETAFLKSTPLDEGTLSDLSTRVVELNSLQLYDRRSPLEGLEGLRLLSLENPDTLAMDQGQLLTPHAGFDLYTSAWAAKPCEALGGETQLITLKRPNWGATDVVGTDGRGHISGSHEILVDCLFGGEARVYRGRYDWRLKFKLTHPLVFEELELVSDFKDLSLVGPGA